MYAQIARNKRRTIACILSFLLVWMGIGALVGWLWASASTSPDTGLAAPTGTDTLTGVAIATALALGGIAFALTSGARLVLRVSGAQPADPERFRQVHNLVAALAVGEGLPTPDVYVIDDPSPNAFATGADPQHAAITVTTGLIAVMNREELEGVLAHEMSHIKNYDVRLLLVVSTLIGMAGLLAGVVWRSGFLMGGRGRRNSQTMIIFVVLGVLLALVAMIFGPLVRLALSRQRESLADVSGVELTRNPAGLIHALQKLQANTTPLERSSPALAAMCINDPTEHRSPLQRLFDTHPPLAERIAVLEGIAQGRTV